MRLGCRELMCVLQQRPEHKLYRTLGAGGAPARLAERNQFTHRGVASSFAFSVSCYSEANKGLQLGFAWFWQNSARQDVPPRGGAPVQAQPGGFDFDSIAAIDYLLLN